MDGDGDADQRQGDEDPAQGVEVRYQRQDRGLGFGNDLLRHLHPGCTDGSDASRPAALQGAAVGQHLAGTAQDRDKN